MKTKHKTTDIELDIIYDYVYYLLKRGQFLVIDSILRELVMYINSPYFKNENLTKIEILGYLTCCFRFQKKLNNYEYLFVNVKDLFEQGELIGLEPKE